MSKRIAVKLYCRLSFNVSICIWLDYQFVLFVNHSHGQFVLFVNHSYRQFVPVCLCALAFVLFLSFCSSLSKSRYFSLFFAFTHSYSLPAALSLFLPLSHFLSLCLSVSLSVSLSLSLSLSPDETTPKVCMSI